MILDSTRTVLVWLFSLAIHSQPFSPTQLAGFLILIAGSLLLSARAAPLPRPTACRCNGLLVRRRLPLGRRLALAARHPLQLRGSSVQL